MPSSVFSDYEYVGLGITRRIEQEWPQVMLGQHPKAPSYVGISPLVAGSWEAGGGGVVRVWLLPPALCLLKQCV